MNKKIGFDLSQITKIFSLKVGKQGLELTDWLKANAYTLTPFQTELLDRKSTRLNSSHRNTSRMPSSA